MICRGREEVPYDHFAQWGHAKVHTRRIVHGFGPIPRARGLGWVWVPRVRMDVEVGEGHGRHLCGEESQVVVDYIEVFERL